MGVVSRRWVWVESMGVVRRYIYFLILLIPTPLVSALFCSSTPIFCSLKNIFFALVPVHFCNLCNNYNYYAWAEGAWVAK